MAANHQYFESPEHFNKWLNKHHRKEAELWLCYYKKHTGKASITWEESVEEALCYGWIDGLRQSIDEESYKIRFTPRRKTSIWSAKNIATMNKIIKSGKVKPAGLEAYSHRTTEKSEIYTYEQDIKSLPNNYLKQLKADPEAQRFYDQMAPSKRKISIGWIMSAKKEETQERRFKTFFDSCKKGELIPLLRWSKSS